MAYLFLIVLDLKYKKGGIFMNLLKFFIYLLGPAIGCISAYYNHRTVIQVELSKEEFAREIEALKRENHLIDEKNKLILNFLGATNAYLSTYVTQDLQLALEASGKVLAVCTPKQADAVNSVIIWLHRMQGFNDSTLERQELAQAIITANQAFTNNFKS
ncbi:hypothetical protein HC141_00225 [Lactobacillus mulieris]|nr:hypothetical protein [Lactobacillus mulieris]